MVRVILQSANDFNQPMSRIECCGHELHLKLFISRKLEVVRTTVYFTVLHDDRAKKIYNGCSTHSHNCKGVLVGAFLQKVGQVKLLGIFHKEQFVRFTLTFYLLFHSLSLVLPTFHPPFQLHYVFCLAHQCLIISTWKRS